MGGMRTLMVLPGATLWETTVNSSSLSQRLLKRMEINNDVRFV